MNNTFLLIFIILALTGILNATISTDPASGIIGVGDEIIFYTECHDEYSIAYWCYGDGFCELASSGVPYMLHFYRKPGIYTVHVNREPSTEPGCPTDEYTTVTVIEDRVISANPAVPIVGQVVTFTVSNVNIMPTNFWIVSWDMGDGTTYKIKANTVTHTYTQDGTYTVKAMECIDNSCKWKSSQVTLVLTVTPLPHDITYSPAAPRVDQPVDIQAHGFTSESIDWNFGDGSPVQTYSAFVSHRYQNPGMFTITAVEHGTSATPASKAITILPENRSLALSVLEAKTDEPITITAVNFRGPQVLWDFGDGSTASGPGTVASYSRPVGISGPATMTHAYKLPGNYTITARDENGASEKTFQAQVKILGISDQVSLEIAEISLDNGKYYKVISKKSKNIRAQLRMKMKGTGIVSGYWIVDGQPHHFFNETVYQGQIKTILTPEVPGLPAFDPGMHTISMQLTRPANERVIFPTLRYYVLPYENVVVTLSPKDGAVIKEDEIAKFAWESALGGSFYQVAFANSIFPLLFNDEKQNWLDCPDRYSFTPEAETWNAIKRNQWTYWKVRAVDSSRSVVAESDIQEMKIIVQGAKIIIDRITDMNGKSLIIGSAFTVTRADHVLIYGYLTYPAAAEYLILQIYANERKVNQLLFRDFKKDEKRTFETSVPNIDKENQIVFQVLKSSSPSVIIGYEELKLKHE